MTQLLEGVWTVLNRTLEVYRDSPRATNWLRRQLDRFDGPLRIAVVGHQKAGKSTLVNALVGEQVAPLGSGEASTWYRAGATPHATVYPVDGPPAEAPAERHGGMLSLDLDPWQGREIDRVVVDWPARSLRGITLIDTPAGDPQPSTIKRIGLDADAVLYVAQHLQTADIRLLQSMHDHPIAQANPVGVLLVLSRADEVGASQLDALFTAKRLARQHRRDVRTMALCQDAVAVTGLLAYAGKTLRQQEFDALSTVAFGPRAELDGYLLSADRFAGNDFPVPLDAGLRRALLDRLGLFGVRLCTTLIRQGFDSHTALCAELVARSGLPELREAIGRYFTDRDDVLKARSALVALDVVLRMEPRPKAMALIAEFERTLAGAHDLRELRLLASLHAGRPALGADLDAEARRLVGGEGVSLPARLGLDEDATLEGLHHAAVGALQRWQEQAENPILDAAARAAAATVVRTCEGILATLQSAPDPAGAAD